MLKYKNLNEKQKETVRNALGIENDKNFFSKLKLSNLQLDITYVSNITKESDDESDDGEIYVVWVYNGDMGYNLKRIDNIKIDDEVIIINPISVNSIPLFVKYDNKDI